MPTPHRLVPPPTLNYEAHSQHSDQARTHRRHRHRAGHGVQAAETHHDHVEDRPHVRRTPASSPTEPWRSATEHTSHTVECGFLPDLCKRPERTRTLSVRVVLDTPT